MSRPETENMLYKCISNESVNPTVCPGLEDFKWNKDSVMLLISLYKSKKSEFLSGFVKKRDLWSQIASEMSSQGRMVTLIACEKKWHNLSATYRRLKECSSKKKNCWPYFFLLQELLEENCNNVNLSKESNMGNSSNCNVKVEPSTVYESRSCSMNSWLPILSNQMKSPNVEGETLSCDRDISKMLSVTIEENLDHSHPSSDQVHISNSFLSGSSAEFKWTHDSVTLLCSLYLMRKEQFISGAVKKRDLWSDIALEMKKEGYLVSCIACEKKWHNLIATYKKVSLYSRKKTWPYLKIFQKIVGEQSMHSSSTSLSEFNYPKNFQETATFHKPFCKEMDYNSNDPLLIEHKGSDEFKWTHASVICLCKLYKENRHDFFSNTIRKRDLWMNISHEMNSRGYTVTWLHCEKKWYNLYATYKKVIDQNRKKTRIWSTWPYLKFFQDIFSVMSYEQNHPFSNTLPQTKEECFNGGCPLPFSVSEKSPENLLHESVEQNPKKQCINCAPDWFLEYCKKQQEIEEKRQEEAERQHQELLEAINIGNSALLELNCNLKVFLNKSI